MFVEIKSNLFKKVDTNHLYQISCSDAKERFHYVLLLTIVCIRNMTEVAWNIEHLWVLLPDAFLVLLSECMVDWGKHAFVLKFNEIHADIYSEFKVKLALDMASSRQNQAFTDHSDLVSRRMGLTPLPLACLLFKILSKTTRLSCRMSVAILIVLYFCLMSFKILNSIVLLGHSYDIITAYDKQKTAASQEEPTSPTSDNFPSEPLKKSASFSDKLPSEMNHYTETTKHRGSEELNSFVIRNESQVFFANSYSDLTMVPNNTVIEASPHHKVSHSATSIVEETEDKIIESVKMFEMENSFDDTKQQSTESHDGSGDACSASESHDTESHDVSCDASHGLSNADCDVTVRQRKSHENQCSDVDTVMPSEQLKPEIIGNMEDEQSQTDSDSRESQSPEKSE